MKLFAIALIAVLAISTSAPVAFAQKGFPGSSTTCQPDKCKFKSYKQRFPHCCK